MKTTWGDKADYGPFNIGTTSVSPSDIGEPETIYDLRDLVSLDDVVSHMRETGVTRLQFVDKGRLSLDLPHLMIGGRAMAVCEVNVSDTIPAPPPAFDEPDPAEEKLPSECIAPGCHEANGWPFDSRYCAPHGRRAAGVKP